METSAKWSFCRDVAGFIKWTAEVGAVVSKCPIFFVKKINIFVAWTRWNPVCYGRQCYCIRSLNASPCTGKRKKAEPVSVSISAAAQLSVLLSVIFPGWFHSAALSRQNHYLSLCVKIQQINLRHIQLLGPLSMKNGIKDAFGFSFLKRSEKSQASLASHPTGLMNLHRLIQILFLSLALFLWASGSHIQNFKRSQKI